jgi:uncharacterized protein (TIGR02722 family)
MKKSIACIVALLFIAGCGGGKTQYLDASKDQGSKEFGPREIKATVTTMVKSMYDFLKVEWKQPSFVQVKKFLNKTSEHIDTAMISNEIQTNLIKKRIKFIDDALTGDAIKEMEKGMTGMMDPDSAIPVGQLKSPNLYLTGDIRDNVRTVSGREIQYLVVTLKLYNLKTQVIEWQDQQEFLKSSSKTKVSF